jgi:hypothetical protein
MFGITMIMRGVGLNWTGLDPINIFFLNLLLLYLYLNTFYCMDTRFTIHLNDIHKPRYLP